MESWGNSVDVILLAGGKGTRLKNVLPSGFPKLLAPIGGRPFIDYLIDYLYSSGAKHIIFALGFGSSMVEAYLNTRSFSSNIKCNVSVEAELLGTAGAIKYASSLLSTEIVCVMNGDTICDIDFDQMLASHLATNASITIALTKVKDISRYGSVVLGYDHRINAFIEKGSSTEAGWISAGIYLINKDVVFNIPSNQYVSLEKEIFPEYVGKSLYGFRAGSDFIDIGTPDSLIEAESFFKNFSKL